MFVLLSILPYVSFPAVLATKPAVEEVVALLPGNLEIDKTEAFSRSNWLLTFTADDGCPEFHRSPPPPRCLLLVGKLVSQRSKIPTGFPQASACLVNGLEYFGLVDTNSHFGLVRVERLLDNEHFFVALTTGELWASEPPSPAHFSSTIH